MQGQCNRGERATVWDLHGGKNDGGEKSVNENQAFDAVVGAKVDRASCLPRVGFTFSISKIERARANTHAFHLHSRTIL